MARAIGRILEWLKSDEEKLFRRGVRVAGFIGPDAILCHDQSTAERMVAGFIAIFWYWDRKIPHVKSWAEIPPKELDGVLLKGEAMRAKRSGIAALLEKMRETAQRMRRQKSESFAARLVRKIDDFEREWDLLVDKRTADGIYEGKWSVIADVYR